VGSKSRYLNAAVIEINDINENEYENDYEEVSVMKSPIRHNNDD
jgi:hypothetical protein